MGVETVSRLDIVLLRERNPHYTLEQIGREVPRLKPYGPLSKDRVSQILREEGKPTRGIHNKDPYYAKLRCAECRRTFERLHSVIKAARESGRSEFFCKRECSDKWHRRKEQSGGKKWSRATYKKVWHLHKTTGYGCLRLSRLVGIPQETVSFILRKMRAHQIT